MTKIVISIEVTGIIRDDSESHPPNHLERRLTLIFPWIKSGRGADTHISANIDRMIEPI